MEDFQGTQKEINFENDINSIISDYDAVTQNLSLRRSVSNLSVNLQRNSIHSVAPLNIEEDVILKNNFFNHQPDKVFKYILLFKKGYFFIVVLSFIMYGLIILLKDFIKFTTNLPIQMSQTYPHFVTLELRKSTRGNSKSSGDVFLRLSNGQLAFVLDTGWRKQEVMN